MPDIVLKDRAGNDITLIGASFVRVPNTSGELVNFYTGDKVEKTIDLDFSQGNIEVVPEDGSFLAKVTINKPANLLPENVAEDVEIAGIMGSHSGGGSGIDIVQVAENRISEIDSEAVITTARYAFYNNTALSRVNTPNLTTVGERSFYGCTALSEIIAPKLTTIGNNGFYGCSALKEIDVSNVQSVGGYAFGQCKGLTTLDFGTSLNSLIGANAFSTGAALNVIIRNTTMLPTPSNKYGYLFGMTTQKLFVPRALVSTWKSSNYMVAYHSNQVFAIEDYPSICG